MPDKRKLKKKYNSFAVLYGTPGKKIAELMTISYEEAKILINKFFSKFPIKIGEKNVQHKIRNSRHAK